MSDPAADFPLDLLATAREQPPGKPVWAHLSTDLAINLVTLAPGEEIAWHVNAEVDVLFVGVDGNGTVSVDGRPLELAAGRALLVPKGARRAIRAGDAPFSYLSCHKRRKPLGPVLRLTSRQQTADS